MFTAAYVVRDKMPWQVDHPLDMVFQALMPPLPYLRRQFQIPQNEYTERVQYGAAFVSW